MIIEDIASLAKGFNPREAAYFSEYLKKSKIKQYVVYNTLFKAIRKQRVYDDDALLKKFKPTISVARFSEIKNYLAELMLNGLLLYHTQSSTVCRIHRLAEISVLLYEKRLYLQSLYILEKARKEAMKFEKHYLLLEICEYERLLLNRSQAHDVTKALKLNSLDKALLFKKIQNEDSFSSLNDQMFIIYNKQSLIKDKAIPTELVKFISDPLLHEISKALTFDSRLKFHYIHAIYNRLAGNYKKVLHHRQEVIKSWNSKPQMKTEMPIRYREDLSNLLSALHLLRNYEGFEELIILIEKQKTNTGPEEDASIFRQVYYLRQLYLLNTNKKEEALALIPEIEDWLEKNRKFIGQSRLFNFWHNIAITLFLNEKYKETLPWVKKLIAAGKHSEERHDLTDFAQIFEVVLYFETGDSELVEYMVRNTRDRLRYNKRLYEFDTIVLSSLNYLLAVQGNKEKTAKGWKDFLQKLNVLYKKPGMDNLLGLEEIILWVQGKIR